MKNSLYLNIRKKAEQNRRTGATPKKPTKEMLDQEKKIKAQYANGGYMYPEGGTVLNKDGLLIAPTLPEFEVVSEAPQWLKYKNEYEQKNPKSTSINKYLTPFARGLGNDEHNYPKRFDDEYNTDLYNSYTDKLLNDFSFEFTDKEQELVDKYAKTERDKSAYKYFKDKNQDKKWQDEYLEAVKDVTVDTFKDQLPDIASKYSSNPYVAKLLKLPHLNKIQAAHQFFWEGRPLTALSELIKIPKNSSIATDALLNIAQENPAGYDLATLENKYLSPVRLGAGKNDQIISNIGKEIMASGETKDSHWINRKYNLPTLTEASKNFEKKYGVSQNDFVEFIENYMVGRGKTYKETLDAYDRYLQAQPNQKANGGPVGNDPLYNMQRALELGYTPDETGHWDSVDFETGMFLKSKEHPTAWMEYLYGYTLNPELNKTTNVIVNPEGYFGENQLQYVPKAQYSKGGLFVGYAEGGPTSDDEDLFKSKLNQGQTVGKPAQEWLANWVQNPEFANRLNQNFPAHASDIEKKIYGFKEARERASAANLKTINKRIPDVVSDIYNTNFLYNIDPENNAKLLNLYRDRLKDPKSIKDFDKNISTNPQGFTDVEGNIIISKPQGYSPESISLHELIHKSGINTNKGYQTFDKMMKGKFQRPAEDKIDKNYAKDEMYPFLMQMRFDNKFIPGEEITPERLKQIRESGYKNHLFNYYSDDEISKYLNTLASNQTQTPIQYAAQGGYMYHDGGWLDNLISALNPYNWGVPDYTDKYPDKDKAFAAARKAGEKEYLYDGIRYTTDYDLSQEEIPNKGDRLVNTALKMAEKKVDITRPPLGRTEFKKEYRDNTCVKGVCDIFKKAGINSGIPDDVYDNRAFAQNYKDYGFELIDNKDLKPGDVVQYYNDNIGEGSDYNLEHFPYHLGVAVGNDEYVSDGSKFDPMQKSSLYYYDDKKRKDPFLVYRKTSKFFTDKELSELDPNKKNFDTLALQKELANRGYDLSESTKQDGSFDGVLGPETIKALEDWQNKYQNKKSQGGYMYAEGGNTNPYMYYSGGPIEYGNGGRVLKHIGAGAYALGEGILDTVTMGATDKLTDKGFEYLTKVGNKNIDLNNPDDVKFLKTQQKVKGYSNTAGAIGAGIATGNVQGAITQGTKGLNTAFQATDGLSDDFKQWSQGITGVAGVASGFAGGLNSDSFNAAAKAGTGVAGFGQKAGKIGSFGNQAMGMIGGNNQPLWQQGEARQEYLNSPEYLAMKERENQQYVNQGLSFEQGGNINNNSLNLQTDSMKNRYKNYRKKSKGGTLHQYGINQIPDSAGLHHQNAYGGVPIGPDAMAEGGEYVLDGNYVVSDEVDGMNTQTDEFGNTMAQNLKKRLNKYTLGNLNSKNKEGLRRPNDSLAQETINQIKQQAMMETEMARAEAQAKEQQNMAMREAALQYAAAGGKLNKDITKIVEEEYAAAYGGYINPKKYKGLNMPYSGGGKLPTNKDKYSAAMVKKANFARNAAKWKHAQGGPMDPPSKAIPKPVISNEKVLNYIYDMNERGMLEPGKTFQPSWYSSIENREIDLNKELNQVDLERVKSLYNYKQNSRNKFGFSKGGPMVSNVPQPFDFAAQNRGGMMMASGGKMRYDGGGGFNPNQTQYFQPNEFGDMVGADEMYGVSNLIYNNPITEAEAIANGYRPPLTQEDSGLTTYTGPGTGTPKTIYAPKNPTQYTTVGENNFDLTDPFASQNTKEINLPNSNSFTQGTIPIDIQNIVSNNSNNNITDPTTPWYEEPWYSKAARYAPAAVGLAATITGLQNKKRKLTPEKIAPTKIDLERSRITRKEEGRRALDAGLLAMRRAAPTSSSLMGNIRDAILASQKQTAADVAKLYETEENMNAQLAQQAALANQQYGNQFKQLNEEMFQNAQTMALRGAQDIGNALAYGARDERKQYLQEWIAKNRLKTRSYKTNIDGRDVYVSPDGSIYDEQGNVIT